MMETKVVKDLLQFILTVWHFFNQAVNIWELPISLRHSRPSQLLQIN